MAPVDGVPDPVLLPHIQFCQGYNIAVVVGVDCSVEVTEDQAPLNMVGDTRG